MYVYPSTDDQVRRAMDYFTQSGKPLWGFSESSLDMTGLNLMGGCTRVINGNARMLSLLWTGSSVAGGGMFNFIPGFAYISALKPRRLSRGNISFIPPLLPSTLRTSVVLLLDLFKIRG